MIPLRKGEISFAFGSHAPFLAPAVPWGIASSSTKKPEKNHYFFILFKKYPSNILHTFRKSSECLLAGCSSRGSGLIESGCGRGIPGWPGGGGPGGPALETEGGNAPGGNPRGRPPPGMGGRPAAAKWA